MNLSNEVNTLYRIYGIKKESKQCFSACMKMFTEYLEQLLDQVKRNRDNNLEKRGGE